MLMQNAAHRADATPQWEADMTPRVSESPLDALRNLSISAPPRVPNNNNDEDDEDEDEDEGDENREPAVIREPDEDE
jgi:hypothetical protein